MAENRGPVQLPDQVKDAVVEEYLRGDKIDLIQMDHQFSPGSLYRILHEREIPLRTFMVWVPDRDWLMLGSPKRCRHIGGSPKTHCPNLSSWGFPRSNGVWAYCREHMYGRRIRNGIVEMAVHPESPSAQRGYVER